MQRSLGAIRKLDRHRAITRRVCSGGGLCRIEYPAFGYEYPQPGKIPFIGSLCGQPAMSGVSQLSGNILRRPLSIEGKPGTTTALGCVRVPAWLVIMSST